MIDILYFILSILGGIILGIIFFGGLFLTVTRLHGSRQPGILAVFSFFIRSAIVVGGFYLIMDNHVERLFGALIGFFISMAIVRAWSLRDVPDRHLSPRPADSSRIDRSTELPTNEFEEEPILEEFMEELPSLMVRKKRDEETKKPSEPEIPGSSEGSGLSENIEIPESPPHTSQDDSDNSKSYESSTSVSGGAVSPSGKPLGKPGEED